MPIAFRRYRFAAIVAASAIAVNVVALALTPGGFVRNFREVIPALTSTSHTDAQHLSSWSLYSFVPKTAGLLFGPDGAESVIDPARVIVWLPALLYLAGVFFVIRRNRVPQWCWGPLALASIQVLVPVSFVYTTAWAAAAAVWYAQGTLIQRPDEQAEGSGSSALRILVLLALTASLTPLVFTISGVDHFSVPLTMYLSPILVLVTWGVAVFETSRPLPVRDRAGSGLTGSQYL